MQKKEKLRPFHENMELGNKRRVETDKRERGLWRRQFSAAKYLIERFNIAQKKYFFPPFPFSFKIQVEGKRYSQ